MGRDSSSGALRRALGALRKGGGGAGATLLGYLGLDGTRQAWAGDGEAPFIKELPFPGEAERYHRRALLATDAYTVGETLDVEDVRLVGVAFTFERAGGGTGGVSLVPRVRSRGMPDGLWFPLGLIDTALTLVNPVGTDPDGFGSRTVRPCEFRSPQIASGTSMSLTLLFDVSSYHEFRLDAAALTAAVTLTTYLVRST